MESSSYGRLDALKRIAMMDPSASMSRSYAPRASIARVQALGAIDRIAGRPVETTLGGLRDMAQVSPRQRDEALKRIEKAAEDRLQKVDSDEPFNRLHPSSHRLERARGVHPAPSNYNFQPSDPGQREPSRFDQGERYDPPRRARRLSDADGSLQSDDPRASDHWADGEKESIVRELQWMLANTRSLIAVINSRAYPRGKV